MPFYYGSSPKVGDDKINALFLAVIEETNGHRFDNQTPVF